VQIVARGAIFCRNAIPGESRTIHHMTIRHFRQRRTLGWLAILAMLLLALVPTVSRVVGQHAPAHHHEVSQGGHAGHAGHHGGASNDGGDCWSQCGYCDFLAHAPVLGALAHALVLAAVHPSIPAPPPLRQPRLAIAFPTAQPRGPPVLA
jgi:hypothetical protein